MKRAFRFQKQNVFSKKTILEQGLIRENTACEQEGKTMC